MSICGNNFKAETHFSPNASSLHFCCLSDFTKGLRFEVWPRFLSGNVGDCYFIFFCLASVEVQAFLPEKFSLFVGFQFKFTDAEDVTVFFFFFT